MAFEKPTIKIADPNKAGDYIVIAQADFKPNVDVVFKPRPVAPPAPAPAPPPKPEPENTVPPPKLQDDPQPPAFPDAALIATGLDVPVARMGPWLAEQGVNRIEMLVRLQDLETRLSAKALVNSRLRALRKLKG